MKLSTFAASFHDYELDLDYYHGKDILHEGCLLRLDPDYSWERINGKIRNKIRKAQKLNVTIKRVNGTPQDIADFRTVWFDPGDETIPEKLEADEVMYLAYLDNELTGGLILTPSSPTVLYMHNLGSNEIGKHKSIPALLLWHAVEELKDSKWQYIDVGVSFRPTLYTFFKNWKVESYPIIFNPPFLRPDIRLTPFTNNDILPYTHDANKAAYEMVEKYFGDTYTILPRAIHCIKAVLQHLDLKKTDNVAVYKTFDDNEYISGCVKGPIENFCDMSRKIDKNTKAVVVIHEFGYPYEQTLDLKKECEKQGIPLIEDCAWAYGSEIDDKHKIGDVGDYAIFSLPKFTPLQYGGILKGLTITDEENWTGFKLLDYFKREIIVTKLHEYLPKLEESNQKRRENWQRLNQLFTQDGFESFVTLPDDAFPGAYIVKLDDFQEIFERFQDFGVETGRYYQEKSLFLPVHQNLTAGQLDYIYGVFRGKLNLSSNYQRNGSKG